MVASLRSTSLLLAALVVALAGCNPAAPAMNDAGGGDSGPVMTACPTAMVPDFMNQMGPCCYRTSQATHLAMPSLRLRYLNLRAPAGSALVAPIVQGLLNGSLQTEVFNWLVQGMGTAGDGAITIRTGFGTRNMATGTYAFSTMARYAPVTLNGTIMSETVTTQPDTGTLIVPVFDMTGTVLQVELQLHNVQVVTSPFTEMRSCIGAARARDFTTPATLSGYLTVADTRTTMINVSTVHAQLCTLIASPNLTEPMSGPYCDQPQATWMVPPDSLCMTTGTTGACVHNNPASPVCRPDGTGALPACNAWQLVSDFAAVGVTITP